MKTKEYISKFNLNGGWNTKTQKDFLQEISNEFDKLCVQFEAHKSFKSFKNAVKQLRNHWDAISNKIPYGIPDKVWNFFYATVIVAKRDAFYPEMIRKVEMEEEQ